MNWEAGPPQTRNLPAAGPWAPRLQTENHCLLLIHRLLSGVLVRQLRRTNTPARVKCISYKL